jgi:hypothetical protein
MKQITRIEVLKKSCKLNNWVDQVLCQNHTLWKDFLIIQVGKKYVKETENRSIKSEAKLKSE